MFEKIFRRSSSNGTVNDAFANVHPAAGFTYFMSVIIFSMFFTHPYCMAAGMIFSTLYYLTIAGRKAFRFIERMCIVFAGLSLFNPWFNQYGDTVLFYYMDSRRFTLEALYYGMLTASIFTSMMMWFASYNLIMSSDKFIYLFGRAVPSVSLLLSMGFRFVPSMKTSLITIAGARKCIGKDISNGTKKQQFENGSLLISTLTGWALENAIITADSMKSRGYGLKNRTSFAVYRFEAQDRLLLVLIISLAASVIILSAAGALRAVYFPKIMMPDMGAADIICLVLYILLLALPPGLNTLEVIRWTVLRSKI